MSGPSTINFITVHTGGNAHLLQRLEQLMTTQQQLAQSLTSLAAQVSKIGDETRTLITRAAALTDALAAAGNVSPEVEAALAALQEQVRVVDELVPDAPAGTGEGAGSNG